MKCELFWFSYLPEDSLYSALIAWPCFPPNPLSFLGGEAGKLYRDYHFMVYCDKSLHYLAKI